MLSERRPRQAAEEDQSDHRQQRLSKIQQRDRKPRPPVGWLRFGASAFHLQSLI